MVFIIEHTIPPLKRISLFCLFILYMAKIIYSTANLNILVQRNHNSGRLGTGIPDTDLILLRGYNLYWLRLSSPCRVSGATQALQMEIIQAQYLRQNQVSSNAVSYNRTGGVIPPRSFRILLPFIFLIGNMIFYLFFSIFFINCQHVIPKYII